MFKPQTCQETGKQGSYKRVRLFSVCVYVVCICYVFVFIFNIAYSLKGKATLTYIVSETKCLTKPFIFM